MKSPQFALAASLSIALALAGCKAGINGDTTSDETAQLQGSSQDPASANLAPVSNASDNTGAPRGAYLRDQRLQQQDNNSTNADPYADQYSSGDNYDDYSGYDTPVEYAPDPPPALPDYEQPPAPGDDYIWTPGCWNYDSGQGYYWVPGAWVVAPYAGALWTPGWWGYNNGRYGWHRGFWGRHIGYYGGINYGNGYDGHGYEGGYWRGDHFDYNRTVNNINTTIVRNVYSYKVTNVYNNTRVSYNGGRGGVSVQPRPSEIAAYHEQRNPPMTAQQQNVQQARSDRQNFAHVNNGRPSTPAINRPLPADNNVRPPAVRNYQAMREPPQEQQRVEQGRQVNQPQEFENNAHPAPGGSRIAPQQPAPPDEPRNNHQPAPGRPMERQPYAPSQPERVPPVPQPQPMRPAPPPVRPAPQQQQRPEPPRTEPQRPEQRQAPPPEHRTEPTHPAQPQHPEKRPNERGMR